MWIVLTQDEYNDLIKKSANVEQMVEERIEKEREAIVAELQRFVSRECSTHYSGTPQELLKSFVREIRHDS